MMKFGCIGAINQILNRERGRRQTNGIKDEQSWLAFQEDLRVRWPRGDFKCGRAAVIALIHCNGKFLPYCAECFVADLSVANAADATVLLPGIAESDLALINKCESLASWYPRGCPDLQSFERAALTYICIVARKIGATDATVDEMVKRVRAHNQSVLAIGEAVMA